MARGRKTSLTIRLTPAERQTLLAWQRATAIPAGLARRGRIILLLADGVPITAIAATVGISRRFVYKWAQRFLEQGLAGLADQPGRGEMNPTTWMEAHTIRQGSVTLLGLTEPPFFQTEKLSCSETPPAKRGSQRRSCISRQTKN
jgi:hypothetical protein